MRKPLLHLILLVSLFTLLTAATTTSSISSILTSSQSCPEIYGGSCSHTPPNINYVSIDTFTQSDDYRSGSLAGNILLYIRGSGLSDDITSNQVYVGDQPCNIEPIYTSNLQIACYVPASTTFETKQVSVYVSGQKATCTSSVCYFIYSRTKTPIFSYIVPNTVNPNVNVNFGGIFKVTDGFLLQAEFDRYVCNSQTRSQQWLDADNVDFLKCGVGTLEAGSYNGNVNVWIKGNAMQINTAYNSPDSAGNIYNFTVLPRIDSISSHRGTTAGEVLTIIGIGFSNIPTNNEVYFGNSACKVMSSVYTSLQCNLIKPAVINQTGLAPGHAGLKLRTLSSAASIATLRLSDEFLQDGGVKSQVLAAETEYNRADGFSEVMEGFFKAPTTGNYTFMLSSGGPAQLYVSETPLTKDNLTFAAEVTGSTDFRDFFNPSELKQFSRDFYLQEGNYYYIQAVHIEKGKEHLTVGVMAPSNGPRKQFNSPRSVMSVKISADVVMQQATIKVKRTASLVQFGIRRNVTTIQRTTGFMFPGSSSQVESSLASLGFPIQVTNRTFLDTTGNNIVTTESLAGFVVYTYIYLNTSAVTTSTKPIGYPTGSNDITLDNTPTSLVTGTFNLALLGKTVSVNFDETAESLRNILQGIPGVGMPRVTRYGLCAKGCQWIIQFDGNTDALPSFELASHTLSGGKTGTLSIKVNPLQNSTTNKLVFTPIPYNMLFTAEDQPQITLKTKGYPASCPSSQCNYYVEEAVLPVIQSFTLNNDILEIYLREGETLEAYNMNVFFANIQATVISYDKNTQKITAQIPPNDSGKPMIVAGTWTPSVVLNSVQFVDVDPNVTGVLVEPKIDHVEVDTSLVDDGFLVLIIRGTGYGYCMPDHYDTAITVGGEQCGLLALTNDWTVCFIQNITNRGTVNLTVNGLHVTYNLTVSPPHNPTLPFVIISRTVDSSTEESTFVIQGNDFDNTTGIVLTNPKTAESIRCNVCSFNSTIITCLTSALPPANYIVTANTVLPPNNITQQSTNLEIPLEITSIQPLNGSQNGGTVLTITGRGFSTIVNDNQVSYGHMNYRCNVIDANDTVITCSTVANVYGCEETETHNVTVLQRLEYVAECKGTCTFKYLNAYTPTIYNISHTEILAGDSLVITGKNFSSNTQIKIAGVSATVLTVQPNEITVQVPAIPAGQNLKVTGYDSVYGNFIYVRDVLVNHTLKVTDFYPQTGSLAGSILKITGKGFSDNATVTVGATTCQVLSVTPSQLTCKTQANAQGLVVVTQGNYTDSLITANFTSQASATPTVSSISGLPIAAAATEITLTLQGQSLAIATPLAVSLKTSLLTYEGQIISSSATSIQVKFVNVSAGAYALSVQAGSLIARFDNVSTTVDVPLNVQSVTPVVSSLAGGVQLEIVGTGFSRESSAVNVKVAGFNCSITSASFDKILCAVPPLVSDNTQSTYHFGQEALLSGTYFSNGANEQPSAVFDNTTVTYFQPNGANSNCAFGVDFGEDVVAQLTQIQYFPRTDIDLTTLAGSLIQASVDGTIYVNITTLGKTVYDGWNTISSPMNGQSTLGFRYLRFSKGSASSNCGIAELKVRGILLSTLHATNTSSIKAAAKLTVNGKSASLPNVVEYRADNTPVITSLSPKTGSQKGNTLLTLTGTNLNNINQVKIDNLICDITSVSSTQVVCKTRSLPPVSERRERVAGVINAYTSTGSKASSYGVSFLYAEKWSDRDTWGCGGFPKEYDSVHVEVGMNLLIDVSPPKLVAVVVEGALIFADADLEFAAQYILVRNGFIQIGTEAEPIQSNINITLYGDRKNPQLPIFGNKVLGVYEGVVDIHGAPRVISTTLAVTAEKNQSLLQIAGTVDWKVGEKIAISSTSYDFTQTEERVIVSITSTTIQLDKPLQYTHTVRQGTVNGETYQITAEVILLSRNIQIQGDDYSSAQNSYGAHMLFYDPGTESTIVRISYTEITRAGQAGYLGRFPINFQHAGNQMRSYLKGNCIHHTYQRGIQLKGTHYLTVQMNVIYFARGYGINLEDGIERFNVFEDNIVLTSQSVLQYLSTQESPVGFRITNPTNFFRRNKALANPTLGFWFDLKSTTTGAYASQKICPNGETLGAFESNIAAWNNDDGIRLDTFIPRTYPCRQVQYNDQVNPFAWNAPVPAVFKNNIVFGNKDKGVEAYLVGAVTFDGLRAFENGLAGFDISFANQAPINSTTVINSIFIGSLAVELSSNEYRGIRLARSEGLYIQNCTFVNFTATKPALEIDSTYYYSYYYDSGARTVFLKGLKFINVTLRVRFYDYATHIFIDLDGSLTGLTNGGTVVNNLPHLRNIAGCVLNQTTFNGLVCNTTTIFRRIVFYELDPYTIYGLSLNVLRMIDTLNETNRSPSEYTSLNYRWGKNPDASYALPFAMGYSYKVFFSQQTDYQALTFELSPHWISSDPAVNLIFNHSAPREDFDVFRCDRLLGVANIENSTALWNVLQPSTVTGKYLGDWYHDVNASNLFLHLIGGNGTRCYIKGYECRVNCPAPPPGPGSERTIVYWSNRTIWPGQVLPREGDNVVVLWNWTLILDINPPALSTVEVQGELRFDGTRGENIFMAKRIWVRGSLTIGSEYAPFASKATIILVGSRNEDGLLINSLVDAGTKVLGVTGQLSIYGQIVTERVSLVETIYPGTRVIKTSGNLVGWQVGHRIAVTSTEKDAVYEVFEIESISGADITVKSAAQYLHYSGIYTSTVDGLTYTIDMSSQVLLLNRSVTIKGSREDSWGGRIIVTEEYYDTYTATGAANLHYVAMEYMGQYLERAGLSFELMSNVTEVTSVVRSSVMADCLAWGVKFLSAQSVTFTQNTIITTRQFGLYFYDSNYLLEISNNYVLNTILDTGVTYAYLEGTTSGIYIGDLSANALTVFGNTVAGCDIAYVLKASECEAQSPYSNNVAHSSNIGFLILTDAGKCHVINDLTAYKTQFGVLSYFSAPNITAKNLLLTDNKVSIHLNIVGDADAKKVITIQDSFFAAFAVKSYPAYYGTGASCSSNTAIMLGVATLQGKQMPPRIQDRPWETINSDATFNAQQIFTNNTFVNFKDGIVSQCKQNFVLKPSKYAADYTPYSTISKCHLSDVSQDRLVFFEAPVVEQRCGSIPCTGLKNVLIKDTDGSFIGYRGSIVPNGGVINSAQCTFISETNGYVCNDENLAILQFESLDTDKSTRVISPVYITNSNGFSNTLNAFKAHEFFADYLFNRLARFASIIQKNRRYNIEFTGTLPTSLKFAIEGALPTEYSILKVKYYDPQVITVYNANTNTMIHPVPYEFAIDAAIQDSDACGTNYFDRTEKTINFKITADPTCKLLIKKTNVLAVNIRYDMNEDEFWQQGGAARFIDKVASILQISHATIRVISVKKGSVILDVQILSSIQDPTRLEAANSELQGFARQLDQARTGGDLNVYGDAQILDYSARTVLLVDNSSPEGNSKAPELVEQSSILFIAVAAGGALVLIVLAAFCVYKYKQRKQKAKKVLRIVPENKNPISLKKQFKLIAPDSARSTNSMHSHRDLFDPATPVRGGGVDSPSLSVKKTESPESVRNAGSLSDIPVKGLKTQSIAIIPSTFTLDDITKTPEKLEKKPWLSTKPRKAGKGNISDDEDFEKVEM